MFLGRGGEARRLARAFDRRDWEAREAPSAAVHLVVSQVSIATDSRSVSLIEGEHGTEPFASADAADGGGRIGRGEGDDVAQALVVALGVVVLHELVRDGAQMTLTEGDNGNRPAADVLTTEQGAAAA